MPTAEPQSAATPVSTHEDNAVDNTDAVPSFAGTSNGHSKAHGDRT